MGILRVFLAIVVVQQHTEPSPIFRTIDAFSAVQVFYIISGFYMAMVLNEKYTGRGSYRLFISNRFLRIYPAYWCVLGVTLVFWLCIKVITGRAGPLSGTADLGDMRAILFVSATNFLIFGQDLIMFMGVKANGSMFFTSNFWETNPQLWRLLLVPQAWSLSVELTFYIVAPWILKRRASTLVICIMSSLILRWFIYYKLNCYNDPWTYRFFPTELALFLGGSLAYRGYLLLRKHHMSSFVLVVVSIAFYIVTLGYPCIPPKLGKAEFDLFKLWGYYFITCISLPFIFAYTKKSRLDRAIGEFSYPIYIAHMLSIEIAIRVQKFVKTDRLFVVVLPLSLLFAICLVYFVINPIERLRQRRTSGNP